MEILRNITLGTHILFGTISLILFWVPVFTRKGGITHKRVGRWYMYTMWIVVASAVLLSMINIVAGRYVMAAFLGYLSILTAYPLWYAWEILAQKEGISDSYFKYRRWWNIGLFITAILLIIYAAVLSFRGPGMLMLFFAMISLPSVMEIKKSKTKVGEEKPIIEHIRGTLISGIAAYTAFLSFGSRQIFGDFLTENLMFIPWVAPTIIGVIIIQIMKRKYG